MLGVVGSGPVGTIVALRALEKGEEVILFDIGSEMNDPSNAGYEGRQSRKFRVKTHGNHDYPYDFDQFLEIKSKNFRRKWFTSKSKGGFSLVWGGTWDKFSTHSDKSWQLAYDFIETCIRAGKFNFSPSVELFCNCFTQIANRSTRYSESLLSHGISSKPTLVLATKNNALDSDFETWNSKYLLEECMKFEKFEYRSATFISEIDKTDTKIRISGESKFQDFNQVILATGPVANSALLLRNSLSIDRLDLCDTQMIYIPFLFFGTKRREPYAYPYSQFSVNLKYGIGDGVAHAQLYAHLETHLQRYLPKNTFMRKLVNLLFRLMSKFIGVALVYLDTQDSDGLSMEWSNDFLSVRKIDNPARKQAIRNIRNQFKIFAKATRIFPIWALAKKTEVGESYHLGAVSKGVCDEFGRLLSNNKIGVAGSFALNKLESGPITMTSMAQGVRLVDKMFESSPKFGE